MGAKSHLRYARLVSHCRYATSVLLYKTGASRYCIYRETRDIVNEFSDDEDIELCCDDEEDLELDSSELANITYGTPSSFFVTIDSDAGQDIQNRKNNLSNDFDNELFIGMQFESKDATINAIKQFHIKNSVDYIVVESRPDRYVGQCKYFGSGCQWRIRASLNGKRDLWEIRKINGTHTCVSTNISQDHTKLNSSFIANCIIHLVSEDPGIPVKALVKEIVTRFGYTVTYRKAWTAKQIAMSQIYGDWEGSYKELPRWFNTVQCYAPGTIVRYASSRHDQSGSLILDRVFWAFKPCIEGFGFCKPILQVDGTFLTGKYNGTLLIASSQDGNRRIFPVAFAIVEGETKEAWEWFFYNVRTYVTPQPNICIISYRGTGLLGALRTELCQWCNAYSVYCIRHVASNFNKEFKDGDLKEKVIQMGYELMRPRFERMLDDLRQKNPRAAAWLDNIPKEKWTQSYDEGRRYGHMTTNLAECVNGVLKGSRALPITSLVQATYHRLNSWFLHHRNEATSMIMAGHIYCEELTKVLNENNRKATCQTIRTFSRESGVFVVEVPGREGSRHSKVYTVRLNQYWCECGEFQSLRLPCSHVIATCSSMNLDYRQLISPIYRLDNLLKAYGRGFEPIGNEEYWPHYSGPMFIPNPLMRRNRTGRPKTLRIHNEMDDCATEKNKKCGLCRTEGHNRKTCPFKNSEIGESSRH
ncbi:hypothetical protein Lal_00002382 [Lupinus albus]|nr:hypothetical protein Lal_00002382 [Lupinus albus]